MSANLAIEQGIPNQVLLFPYAEVVFGRANSIPCKVEFTYFENTGHIQIDKITSDRFGSANMKWIAESYGNFLVECIKGNANHWNEDEVWY